MHGTVNRGFLVYRFYQHFIIVTGENWWYYLTIVWTIMLKNIPDWKYDLLWSQRSIPICIQQFPWLYNWYRGKDIHICNNTWRWYWRYWYVRFYSSSKSDLNLAGAECARPSADTVLTTTFYKFSFNVQCRSRLVTSTPFTNMDSL